jgi:ricin-type beta-trefoil lectin protein
VSRTASTRPEGGATGPEPEPEPEPDPDRPQADPDPDPGPNRPVIESVGIYCLHSGPGGCLDMGAGNSDGDNVQQWSCNDSPAQRFTLERHGPTDTYTLMAKGLCLDVAAASPDAGSNVQMANCTGVPAQDWRLDHLGDGWYRLVAGVSGHCLDVDDGNPAPGTNVMQWTCNGATAQAWRFERV